ncbi:unnamed protein product, partial [Pylaiella littoralis]
RKPYARNDSLPATRSNSLPASSCTECDGSISVSADKSARGEGTEEVLGLLRVLIFLFCRADIGFRVLLEDAGP